MSKFFSKSTAAPMAWLLVCLVSIIGLHAMALSFSLAVGLAIVFSVVIVGVVSFFGEHKLTHAVPAMGAVLFALLTWIAVSVFPETSVEAGVATETVLTARTLVVLLTFVLTMPLLAFAETAFSVAMVQLVSKLRGRTVLGGELHAITMIDRKYGGLLGTINR